MIKTDTKDLEQLLKQLSDTRPALQAIGRMLVESTQERLQKTKTSPDGAKWAPWSLATLLGRQKKGNSALGLLFDSGSLSRSITYEVTENQVTVGARAKYASFLQDGTDKMPARPFVGISNEDERRIQDILTAHLEKR